MSAKVSNIAKNTSFFTFALILQKVISFTYFAILARFLGPDQLGQYFFAISFTSIFGIIIDIGIANMLTREVAKDQSSSSKLLSNIIAIKIPLMFLSWFFVFLFFSLLGYSGVLKYLVSISIISVTLDSFTYTFYAVSRGHHNLFYESISSVIFQLIVLFFGLYFLYFNYSLLFVIGALLIGSVFNFIYSSLLLKKKWEISFFQKPELSTIRYILLMAIPFGAFAIFQRFYLYLDSVFLKVFSGDYYVGLYQVAFKIIFSLQFLPMAFIASLYPAMSAYWQSDKKQFLITFERAFSYLLIISLPISFGIAFLASQIIHIFSSEYVEAFWPLIIVIASLPFVFLNFPIGSLLNSTGNQKLNTINMGVALFFSVVLNIVLIQRFQAIGASVTVLFTNALMFFLGLAQSYKIVNLRLMNLLKISLKTFIASLLMTLIVVSLRVYLNIFVVVFMSGISYFIFLYLLGGFRKEDILSIYNSLFKK